MKFLLGMIGCWFVYNCYAIEQFPTGCNPIQIKEDVALSVKKTTLLMLHNLSDADLWVIHPAKKTGGSEEWSTHFTADHWGALVLDQSAYQLTCIESRPGHEQQVSCQDSLAICEWPSVTLPKDIKGTFSPGENKILPQLIAYLGRQGYGFQTE